MVIIHKTYGERLATRIVWANGHSGLMCVPVECIGTRYERYIDRTTGIITLIPVVPEERA